MNDELIKGPEGSSAPGTPPASERSPDDKEGLLTGLGRKLVGTRVGKAMLATGAAAAFGGGIAAGTASSPNKQASEPGLTQPQPEKTTLPDLTLPSLTKGQPPQPTQTLPETAPPTTTGAQAPEPKPAPTEQDAPNEQDLYEQRVGQRNPIDELFPYLDKTEGFDIANGVTQHPDPNDPYKEAVYIVFRDEKAKELAIKWIQDQGFDPSALEIIWIYRPNDPHY